MDHSRHWSAGCGLSPGEGDQCDKGSHERNEGLHRLCLSLPGGCARGPNRSRTRPRGLRERRAERFSQSRRQRSRRWRVFWLSGPWSTQRSMHWCRASTEALCDIPRAVTPPSARPQHDAAQRVRRASRQRLGRGIESCRIHIRYLGLSLIAAGRSGLNRMVLLSHQAAVATSPKWVVPVGGFCVAGECPLPPIRVGAGQRGEGWTGSSERWP
jgi:hypothetical protein